MNVITQFSGSVAERLIRIMEDWLYEPQQIQPCFYAGCYSWHRWFFYPGFWAVQKVTGNTRHETDEETPYPRQPQLMYWYELASRNRTMAQSSIDAFIPYLKDEACRIYGILDKPY